MENFEKASKKKLRFESSKGQLSVEQLWDLSLDSLDTIGMKIKKKLEENGTESLISTKPKTNADDELRFAIVKHIIDYKLKQQKERADRQARSEKIQSLQQLAVQKQNEAFSSQSLEEIQKQLAELQNQDVNSSEE